MVICRGGPASPSRAPNGAHTEGMDNEETTELVLLPALPSLPLPLPALPLPLPCRFRHCHCRGTAASCAATAVDCIGDFFCGFMVCTA